ncbi:MAG: hypothetical protein KDC81_14105, partial [Flavobacteriaceae bacterium]|nr:hypothetical protein [Flavobacteriaceae bacterium]
MIKKFLLISIFFLTQNIFSQKEVLYLMIDKPFFSQQDDKITTGFIVKSKDKRFICDYFEFKIFNSFYSEVKNNIDYYNIDELRKSVKIDTIEYLTLNKFIEKKEFWEIHNELSLIKEIFLIEKKDSLEYYLFP